ncbi:MAG: energy transducer TonB [Planctomycetaceae bacterium]|nr:energy transducer TonB [Planctomycetaceae bacterium]
MRTSLAYAVSVGLHGVAFGALAYAAVHSEVLTVGFAVRAGDANGAMSQARRARHIEASFDSVIAEKPAAPVIVPSTDPEPISTPMPTPPSRTAEPPTAANLDTHPTTPSSLLRHMAQRTRRGMGQLASSEPVDAPNSDPAQTLPMTAPSPLAVAALDSTADPSSELPEAVPNRVAVVADHRALATMAAAVTVQPLEPGNDDFDAINANTPQGARVSQMPSRLPRNREPVYPEDLRRQQIGGTVLLRVTIGADGSAEEVTLAKTSGYTAFDDSALQAVRAWRFDPARRNNIAVRYTVKLPITFSVRAM